MVEFVVNEFKQVVFKFVLYSKKIIKKEIP